MRVLFVCSGNANYIAPFIVDLKNDLELKKTEVEIFAIKGKGVFGYLKNLIPLYLKINNANFDLIHAHYGLSSLLACLQFKLPVIITLHGSDVYNKKHRLYSKIAVKLAKKVIIVSSKMKRFIRAENIIILPCGVNLQLFKPIEKKVARNLLEDKKKFQFNNTKKYILFSSSFSREVKNPQLAKDSIDLLGNTYELIELKNFSRTDVALMMNSVDAALLTSKSEGSPQFIKEAMACNCPIISTNVGDVDEIIDGENGCYVCDPDRFEISKYIVEACKNDRTHGRKKIKFKYNSLNIVDRLIELYIEVIDKRNLNK